MIVSEISPEPEPGFVERAPRAMTTLLIGKLMCAGRNENLCRIRNISATGMMVETFTSLVTGDYISVELRSGERLKGRVVWTSSGRAGVQFSAPIDVARVLAEAKAGAVRVKGGVARAPRFAVRCAARISSYGRGIDVTLVNISQMGAQVHLSRPPKRDTQVILSAPGLPQRRCTTRWASDEVAGLAFLDPIPWQELALWLAAMDVPEDSGQPDEDPA